MGINTLVVEKKLMFWSSSFVTMGTTGDFFIDWFFEDAADGNGLFSMVSMAFF